MGGDLVLGKRAMEKDQTAGQDAVQPLAWEPGLCPNAGICWSHWPLPTLRVCTGLGSCPLGWAPDARAWTTQDIHRGKRAGLELPCVPPAGCCGHRVPRPRRRGQPLGPGGAIASSATRPTISLGICLAASTAATPSARRACGGWTRQPTSSAGSPARSAARARPRPAEGWPHWTSTWPPSWPSRPSGSHLEWSPRPPHPSKAAQPSLSNRQGSAHPWAPSPTSLDPDAAAGAAATSAWRHRAAPRSELGQGACCP